MSEFYTELKALREERGIDLEEIHQRTKISLASLNAIENGQFSQLPHTYMRLFVKAYATEIGADAEETLSQLESFLGNKPAPPTPKKEDDEAPPESPPLTESESADLSAPNRSAKHMRKDMVTGIILVAISIFAIYIIRVINAEEAAKAPMEYPSEFEEEGPITDQMLQNDYDVLTQSTQILEAEAPYTLKLATAERVWYRSQSDTLSPGEAVLPIGDNRLIEFGDSLEILFKHTKGLNLYLNGSTLNSFDASQNPVKISLSTVGKTVTIQHFTPKI